MWVSWCKNKSFWHRFTCTDVDGDEDVDVEGDLDTDLELSDSEMNEEPMEMSDERMFHSGLDSGDAGVARVPPDFGGLEKGWSLISPHRS